MSRLYAGIDLGGTKVACALGNTEQGIVAQVTIPTNAWEGSQRVLERIGDAVEQLADDVGEGPSALAMGVPGLSDLERGITTLLPNLPEKWAGVDVRGALEPRLGCPVYLINDVRSATLAELVFGRAGRVDTMAFFAIGTGIGGGVVIGGELRLGPLGQAGELGHQTIVPDGPLCGCGNRGCLEALASGTAITAEATRLLIGGECPHLYALTGGDPAQVDAGKVAEAARAGDASMRWVLERAGTYIGIAACNVIVTIHPELVVIGGGVARVGDLLLEPIRRTVRDRVRMMPPEGVRIEPSKLGADAGMLGAIARAERATSDGDGCGRTALQWTLPTAT